MKVNECVLYALYVPHATTSEIELTAHKAYQFFVSETEYYYETTSSLFTSCLVSTNQFEERDLEIPHDLSNGVVTYYVNPEHAHTAYAEALHKRLEQLENTIKETEKAKEAVLAKLGGASKC